MIEVMEEFNNRIAALEAVIGWDEKLRAENPALQDLYEKYQATKKLTT